MDMEDMMDLNLVVPNLAVVVLDMLGMMDIVVLGNPKSCSLNLAFQ